MKLDQPWLKSPAVRKVLEAVAAAGGEARFVGGCVRDALLGRTLGDFDLATTLPPEEVMTACRKAGCKVIPTGLKHGTITVVSSGQVFEITTLRRDVATDGRHADVVFTDSWREDASRRDFTMNALFCDSEGNFTDYFGGIEDAKAGKVRFVGNPPTRIREDVLRILRFFRFHAHFGKGTPDEDALHACHALVELLPTLSAERVRMELLKLLAAPDPAPCLRLMNEIGVFRTLDLPLTDFARLEQVVRYTHDPLLRLWAVLETIEEMPRKLRLSKAEAARLQALAPLPVVQPLFRAAYRLGAETVKDVLVVTGRTVPPELENWQRPVFPLKGEDVVALGIPRGPDLGRIMRQVEEWWVEQDFAPDRNACLSAAVGFR